MLTLSSACRIFLCNCPIDLRKSFEGLCGVIETTFAEHIITSNAYFVFLNKTRDRMKILYWDLDGLAIWYKRLEQGRFPKGKYPNSVIDRRDFLMLLEGIVPKRCYKRYKV